MFGRPVALLMNLPQLAEDIPAGRPYAAVFARPWYGEAAIWRSAAEDGFEFLDALGRPARIGALAFDLYAGPTGRFDLGNELWVDLPSAALASVTDQALFAGENALAVESAAGLWEVLQFGTVDLMSPGRWRLRRLLRGQLGTEDAIGNPAPGGSSVVVLDAAVAPLSTTDADIGLPWNWRVGPARVSAGDPINLAIEFTPEGRGLRPYSPAHLRGAVQPGGAILLSWTRRTRSAAGDSWVLAEAPLGEEREEYELEILDGATVVRSVAGLSSSSFTYTTAMMTTDFGAPVSTMRFRVFQIGALGRGDGAACAGPRGRQRQSGQRPSEAMFEHHRLHVGAPRNAAPGARARAGQG